MTSSSTSSSRETRRRFPCGVLIADDHDDSRMAERLVLESFGFAVVEARTGLEALVLAQISRPRVVLMDIVLPEIDGCQLARMLRADPATRRCAIVAVTALSNSDDRDAAIAAGCDDYFVKPVPPLRLVDVVRQFARRPTAGPYGFDPMEEAGGTGRNRDIPTRLP